MSQSVLIDIVGWIGAILLLVAYAAVSRGAMKGTSFRYQFLNVIGSAFLLVNAGYYRAFPSSFVNIVWIGIAVFSIRKNTQD
jgi:hypothetical protein